MTRSRWLSVLAALALAVLGATTAVVVANAGVAHPLKATITDDGVNASPPYAVTGSTVTWIAP